MNCLSKPLVLVLTGAMLHIGAVAAPDVAALTFINGLPFVDVKVGATTARMMIDSGGALGISLPQATVRASGSVTLLGSTTRFSDLHGKVFEVQNLLARQVVIGSTQLKPVEGRIHTQWGGAPEGPEAELTKARQAGAIGLAAFGGRPLMFDYALGRLVIYASGEGPQAGHAGWHALRLEYGKEGPNITLRVNGKPLKFVLDTGASVNLVNTDVVTERTTAAQCRDGNAGSAACDPRTLSDVKDLTGRSLAPFQAERAKLNGAPFDGILGAPFFHQHRVLIDLAAHRLLIAAPTVAPVAAPTGVGRIEPPATR